MPTVTTGGDFLAQPISGGRGSSTFWPDCATLSGVYVKPGWNADCERMAMGTLRRRSRTKLFIIWKSIKPLFCISQSEDRYQRTRLLTPLLTDERLLTIIVQRVLCLGVM